MRFRPHAAILALIALAVPAWGQGVVLQGVGPINRSMAGTAVAAPLDASGALYWNPATITAFNRSEIGVGLELLMPRGKISSSVPANSFGPGAPPVGLAGSTSSDSGTYAIPTTGLIYQPEGARWTTGLGLFVVGGFGTNYAASLSNPITTAQPPRGVGLGSIYSDFQVIQLVPTLAAKLTDNISVGFAPTINIANLSADPLFLVPPNDANGDGFPTYPAGTHRQSIWGGGFQVGIYYTGDEGWNFGASLKSKQWFESLFYNSVDEVGRPLRAKAHFDYPLIASIGGAYTGFEKWVLALDLRYLDYPNANGFKGVGFAPGGNIAGLGWKGVFGLATGAQYQLTERVSLRGGYAYSTSPFDNENTLYNAASPLITQHSMYFGSSFSITETFSMSLAWGHLFPNSVSGPFQTPFGAVPGTVVKSEVAADTIVFGANVQF